MPELGERTIPDEDPSPHAAQAPLSDLLAGPLHPPLLRLALPLSGGHLFQLGFEVWFRSGRWIELGVRDD